MNISNYNLEDFYGYFRGAWIRNPKNREQLVQIVNASTGNNTITVCTDNEEHVIPFKEITWENLKLPPILGYRNIDDNPYFVTMKVGRITHKGISDRTVFIKPIPQVEFVYSAINSQKFRGYKTKSIMTHQSVQEIVRPKFCSLKDAINKMSDLECVGQALSPETAVVISDNEDSLFSLLFNEALAATSNDGKRWKREDAQLIDSVTRSIGALHYVN